MHIEGFDDFREIGRGGSSVVFAARQERLDRTVAIKVLNVDVSDAAARRRFERECAVVGALGDAPGIVPVYAAVFTDDGRGGIVMRLMRESLAERVRREGRLHPEEVVSSGVVAATALAHAHSRGVVHRDVKPANLLVSEFDEVALADFDIAMVASSAGAWTPGTVTRESMSPPHAPPEQLDGRGHSGVAGDIWSLGSTLFTLVEGRQPFGSATSAGGMAGLIDRVLHQPVPPLSIGDACPGLDAVLARAMAKDPHDRWPDAAAFATALRALVPEPAATRRSSGAHSAPYRAPHEPTSEPSPASGPLPGQSRHDARATLRDVASIALVLVVVLAAVVAAAVIAFA